MRKPFKIVTNNPLVKEKLGEEFHVEFLEISYKEVLETVRNYVYDGYELLTHPLSGSVKPNETPYKSIMVAETKGTVDFEQVDIIERAVRAVDKFEFKSDKYAPHVYDDFQLVDLSLIKSAIPSAIAW